METWQTILLALGGNAALIAVLAYFAKSLLDKLIARDTKRFEADLKAKSDATIEQLKSELQLKTIEHQVRFSRLHEKRAAVIAEIYGYLVEALWEAESFLSPIEWAGEPSKEEKHKAAMDKLVELYRFLEKHRIYLPADLCASLENLFLSVRTHVIHFGVFVRLKDPLPEHSRQQRENAWNDGWKSIKTEVPLARQKLENEFRSLLGAGAEIEIVEGSSKA